MDATGFLIGIDPGVSGAIVVATRSSGILVETIDMPTVEVRGKRHVCPSALRDAVSPFALGGDTAIVEHVQGVQQSGATSAFNFGRGFGVIEGVLAGLGIPCVLVRPQVWTKALGVGSDKGAHRATAMRLWPDSAELFKRAKDDGRADAALLCHWYARHGNTA
jgi:crossover junction endodeoxyribonuclease RuvC